MVSITFWMFPIAVIMAIMEWLKIDFGIDIGGMIEEWAVANPEIVEEIGVFINDSLAALEEFFAFLNT